MIPASSRRHYGQAISPDGRLLATVTHGERSVRIWDVRTGSQVRRIADHLLPVNSVALHPMVGYWQREPVMGLEPSGVSRPAAN